MHPSLISPTPSTRPIPCPSCRALPWKVGPAGRPQRTCFRCGHTWTPDGDPASLEIQPPERPAPARAGASRGAARQTEDVRSNRRGATELARAGVLLPDGAVLPAGETAFRAATLALTLELAARRGIRQVWAGPATLAALGAPRPPSRPMGWRDAKPDGWTRGLVDAGWTFSTSVYGWGPWVVLERDGLRIDLVLPSWDSRNPFAGARSPSELLHALARFAELLQIRYRRSPGATGTALMRRVCPAHVLQVDRAVPDVEWGRGMSWEDGGGWVAAKSWKTLPAEDSLTMLDINGMFLAACSTVTLGYGPCSLVGPGASGAGFQDVSGCLVPPELMPLGLPFRVRAAPTWMPAPYLDLMREIGLGYQSSRSWVYESQSRWLEPWYVILRDARSVLFREAPGPVRDLVLGAVKDVYTRSIGWLDGHWLDDKDELFRPDWRAHIIARARSNMYRALLSAHRAGIHVVASRADAALIHHRGEAVPPGAFVLSDQLGKWKRIGSLSVKEAVSIQGRRPSLVALQDVLDRAKANG